MSKIRRGSRQKPIESSREAYEVGYRKPPVSTRFVKGRSGNPKGRPKKAKGQPGFLSAALNQSVNILENGISKRITYREAIYKSLVNRALKGDTRAVSVLMNLMEQYGITESDRNEPIYIITGVPRPGD